MRLAPGQNLLRQLADQLNRLEDLLGIFRSLWQRQSRVSCQIRKKSLNLSKFFDPLLHLNNFCRKIVLLLCPQPQILDELNPFRQKIQNRSRTIRTVLTEISE